MRLGDLLHSDAIKTDLQASTKRQAIEELVDVLIESHEIPLAWRDHVLEAVLEREEEASTGMEYGVALPHGISDRVDDVIVALGISREGVPFDSLDGISARIIVLMVFSRRAFHGKAESMAGVALLLHSAKLRDALRAAKTPIDVLRIIRQEEDHEFAEAPAR